MVLLSGRSSEPKGAELATCVTLTIWPSMRSVPVRGADEVLEAMLKVAVPFPEPLFVTGVIHKLNELTVHEQPVPVVTLRPKDWAVDGISRGVETV
jgi:hypothetical protein